MRQEPPLILTAWLDAAEAKLAAGTLAPDDLRALRALIDRPRTQRLLYLHAREPVPTSPVIAWSEHPGEDPGGQEPRRPYATVLEAMADGWRVIHFPQQLAPFDDREVDIAGYEFVLEKLE